MKNYTKKILNPDNYSGVITHQEPDILEYEVKCTIGSITTNKANEGNGIPAELFQILKDDAVNHPAIIHQNASKSGKLSSIHKTGKGQFPSNLKERQCQRMLKLPHNCTHLTH